LHEGQLGISGAQFGQALTPQHFVKWCSPASGLRQREQVAFVAEPPLFLSK
jgi:hypothetical protein